MPFNISEFSASISKYGIAKPNQFEVIITLPNNLQSLEEYIPTRELVFRATAVTLPQLDLNTRTFYPLGVGRGEKRAMGLNEFTVVPVKFIVDEGQGVVKFFHNWIQNIVNYNIGGNEDASLNDIRSYEVGYKRDYAAPNILINVYSHNVDVITYQYSLFNAYPVNTPSTTLDWNMTNDIMTLDIGFTYDAISVTGMTANQGSILGSGDRGVETPEQIDIGYRT